MDLDHPGVVVVLAVVVVVLVLLPVDLVDGVLMVALPQLVELVLDHCVPLAW